MKDHLYRVGLFESAGCECEMPETVEHLLLECTLYAAAREMMRNIIQGTDIAARAPRAFSLYISTSGKRYLSQWPKIPNW